MKKIGCFLMIVIALVFMNSMSKKIIESNAASATKYQYQVLNQSKKTAALTYVENPPKYLVIPDKIDGYTITQVGVFKKRKYDNLENWKAGDSDGEVVISASAKENVVEEIRFSETVEIIGTAAFRGCYKLRKVTFPTKLKFISDTAFERCLSLKSVNLGKVLEGIGCMAFYNCRNLKKVQIKSNKVKIGYCVFDCGFVLGMDNENEILNFFGSLSEVKLPLNFYGELMGSCLGSYAGKSFKWLNFKGKTVSLGFFGRAVNLKEIIFPKGVKKVEIGRNTLPVDDLKQLIIPNTVKKFMMNQQSSIFKRIIVKGKNTKLEKDYCMGSTLANYICTKTIVGPKGSKAETFTKKCLYPARMIHGEDHDDYYNESNTKMKKVKFIGISLPKKPVLSVRGKKIIWKKVKGVERYDVYYSSAKNGKYKKLNTTKKASVSIKKKGYVKVRSVKISFRTDWNSKWSSAVRVY